MVIRKMMAKKAEDRFQTPSDVAKALSLYRRAGSSPDTMRINVPVAATAAARPSPGGALPVAKPATMPAINLPVAARALPPSNDDVPVAAAVMSPAAVAAPAAAAGPLISLRPKPAPMFPRWLVVLVVAAAMVLVVAIVFLLLTGQSGAKGSGARRLHDGLRASRLCLGPHFPEAPPRRTG
jgi:hypothetical protein